MGFGALAYRLFSIDIKKALCANAIQSKMLPLKWSPLPVTNAGNASARK